MKNLLIQSLHLLKDDLVAYMLIGGLIQPHRFILTPEVEGITRKHEESFLGLGCHGEDERAWRGREFQMKRFEREESNCGRK